MFRIAVSEFTLTGASRGPWPSYQPAVLALEERVVPSGSSLSYVEEQSQGLLEALRRVSDTLEHRHNLKLPALKNLRTIQNGLRSQIVSLGQIADPSTDPTFWQTLKSFDDLDDVVTATWKERRKEANDRANARLGRAAHGIGTSIAQQQVLNRLRSFGNNLFQQLQHSLGGHSH